MLIENKRCKLMLIENILENYNQEGMQTIAADVLRIAERRVYDESAEDGSKVTHDQIMVSAQNVLQELESQIGELIQQEFSGQS